MIQARVRHRICRAADRHTVIRMFDSPGNPQRRGRTLASRWARPTSPATHGGAAGCAPSELTLHGQRLTGFVDRVGDPVPMVAPDGSESSPRASARGGSGHGRAVGDWRHAGVRDGGDRPGALAAIGRRQPSPHGAHGVPVVSDATAALTALRANPGLAGRGVIVLCDFGGSGTSITLANASSNYAVVGETVRFADFSGDQIDQALLSHVVSELGVASLRPVRHRDGRLAGVAARRVPRRQGAALRGDGHRRSGRAARAAN